MTCFSSSNLNNIIHCPILLKKSGSTVKGCIDLVEKLKVEKQVQVPLNSIKAQDYWFNLMPLTPCLNDTLFWSSKARSFVMQSLNPCPENQSKRSRLPQSTKGVGGNLLFKIRSA